MSISAIRVGIKLSEKSSKNTNHCFFGEYCFKICVVNFPSSANITVKLSQTLKKMGNFHALFGLIIRALIVSLWPKANDRNLTIVVTTVFNSKFVV